MQTMGARQASNRFGSLINTVQEGNTVKITRNGREAVVVISPLDFELLGGEKRVLEVRVKSMQQKREEFEQSLDALQNEAEKNGLTQEILNDIINDQ